MSKTLDRTKWGICTNEDLCEFARADCVGAFWCKKKQGAYLDCEYYEKGGIQEEVRVEEVREGLDAFQHGCIFFGWGCSYGIGGRCNTSAYNKNCRHLVNYLHSEAASAFRLLIDRERRGCK